ATQRVEAIADVRHGRRGSGSVDGYAHELGPGGGERAHLRHRGGDVRGVGIGHRLHNDRRIPADLHTGYVHRRAISAMVAPRVGPPRRVAPAVEDVVHVRYCKVRRATFWRV